LQRLGLSVVVRPTTPASDCVGLLPGCLLPRALTGAPLPDTGSSSCLPGRPPGSSISPLPVPFCCLSCSCGALLP